MKKILKIIIISLFSIFSFYYTQKVINLSKQNDPIMKEIQKNKMSKNIKPINGIIEGNSIIIGESGKKIDTESSYEKMKKIKEYDEDLLEYINIKPVITKQKNLDKTVIGASTTKKEIAIVFKTNDISLLNQIVYILDKNKINTTFFIDGKVLENDILKTKELLGNNRVGIYSYNDIFNNVSVKYIKSFITKNFNYSNYCLYKDDNFLKSCKYYKINTIKPELIDKELYNYLKNNKKNGFIYEIKVNSNNIKQLNSSLIYLKSKGYSIVTIDELLKE